MDIHKIVIPTPYVIGDVNAFLVKGEALSLFDAGPKTGEAYEALKWGIKAAGYDMSDIEQVVLTHHHPDHAGWVDAFPNVNILGHEYVDHWMRKTPEFINYRDEFYRHHLKLQAVPEIYIDRMVQARHEIELFGTIPLTHFIEDGVEVPGHPGLKSIYTPGHAQSHLIFHDKKTNTVIGGDILLQNVASNPLVEPPVNLSFERTKSLIQYQNSQLILKDLHVNMVYTGHGDNITNASELITMRLERDHMRAKHVYQLLDSPKTVFEIAQLLYPAIFKSQLGLTLSKAIGYLDLLEREGLVMAEQVEEVYIYSRA